MTAEALLAGVDVGTTHVKAGVYEPGGRAVAVAAVATPVRSREPGRADHDAEALWDAVATALRDAVDRVEAPTRIAGVAVASMAEAGVPLDSTGTPTAPVIAWFDRRSEAQARRLADTLGADRLRAVTGVPPQPIYGICKLAWLAEHDPEAFARTRTWLNVADYVAYRLCGHQATDLSLATRTGALDLRARRWSSEVLDAAEIPATLFAPLVTSGTGLGRVTRSVARATGLPEHTVVGAGGHDHVCGALAAGVTDPGRALDSMGTAESLLVPLTAPLPTDATTPRFSQGVHVAADRWYAAAGVHASGASLEWALRVLDGDRAALLAEAGAAPPGAHGVVFAPHLALAGVVDGAPGALVGLAPDTERGAVTRAVLEGLAVAAGDVLARLIAQAGLPHPPSVRVIGGGARTPLLLAIKAAVTGWTLHRPETTEAAALGAALLGGVAAGVYPGTDAAMSAVEHGGEDVVADPDAVAAYEDPARRIRALHDLVSAG